MEVFIGIDPGKSGAYAVLVRQEDGVAAHVFPWDEKAYTRLMRDLVIGHGPQNMYALIERVSAMPGQGVKSMFTFGEQYGFLQGVLAGHGIPYETVPPQAWKKYYHLGKDKQASIDTARRLYPDVDLHRTERCKTEHDGMAEALLIANYAMLRKGL